MSSARSRERKRCYTPSIRTLRPRPRSKLRAIIGQAALVTRTSSKKLAQDFSVCVICGRIEDCANKYLQDAEKTQIFSIASYADFQKSSQTCGTCGYLFRSLDTTKQEHGKPVDGNETFNSLVAWYGSLTMGRYMFHIGFSHSLDNLPLLPEKQSPKQKDRFIPIHNHYIDLQQIREWIKVCDEEHGAECQPRYGPGNLSLPPTMLLIDVHDDCLIRRSEDNAYVCLSYVWGSAQKQFQTVTFNFDQLQHPGSLSPLNQDLPATVRDAINLTKDLGLRYLWVDRLCILQNDEIHKSTQIGHMAGIYNNASFTICATDGADAEYGLRGINRTTKPRHYAQEKFRFGSSIYFAVASEDSLEHDDTKWYTRGWTYQESILSNRRVMFNHQLVKWACRKAIWSEIATAPSRAVKVLTTNRMSHELPRYPLLGDYCDLTRSFMLRSLGDERDRLNAFAGVLSSLSRSFPGGFHFGLPQCLFDHALLWQTPVEAAAQKAPRRERNFGFPSWSWLGWRGCIDWSRCEEQYSPDSDSHLLYLQPTVKWSRRTYDGQASDFVPLYNHWITCRDNDYVVPPPGWMRYASPGWARECFEHESLSKTELGYSIDTVLRHPVPTHDAEVSSSEQEWSPILNGQVFTNRFRLHVDVHSDSDWKLYIMDGDRCIGDLVPNVDPSSRVDLGMEHFICISKATSGSWSIRTTINVVWVEWREGIAYRLGVGVIDEEAWLAAGPTEISIKLG